MSGHSKFANIKHKKEKNDAAKGKIFTIIGREIAVAVKEGGPDPANNFKLATVIAKAKANNMPNDTIERGIKKAAGDVGNVNYKYVTYEGYGPNGIAIIVDALTDNTNRTAANVRSAFTKGQGNVGTPGCVSFMFDKKGQIIVDNVIPYIGGEEEKSEREPLKLWGHIEGDHIVNAEKPVITAQCFRVPVSDGHTAAVFVSFEKKPTQEQILEAWANFRGPAQELDLPSAPKQFLHYFTEPDRPQPKLDRNTENGMAVCIGRLREDTLFDYKFACMSHNTLRGAAGGGVLLAELLAAKGYFD